MSYLFRQSTKLLLKLKKKYICQSNIPTSFCSHPESTANDTLKAQECINT